MFQDYRCPMCRDSLEGPIPPRQRRCNQEVPVDPRGAAFERQEVNERFGSGQGHNAGANLREGCVARRIAPDHQPQSY